MSSKRSGGLRDISWNIGVTAASSDEDTTGKTYVHFKLVNGEEGDESLHLELTPSDFYRLLHEMERAKANLQALAKTS